MAITVKLKTGRAAADEGKNDAHTRWQRGVFLAGMLEDKGRLPQDDVDANEGVSEGPRKILEVQHWLELTDRRAVF